MTARRFTAAILLAATAGLVLAGCGGDDKKETSSATTEATSTGKGGATVGLTAKDFEFEPKTLTAKAGQAIEVTIKNEGQAEHNFSIESLKVSKDIEKGETAKVTFTPTATGNIEFFCEYHKASKNMVGTLQVT